jgi:hypothetical protein
MPQAMLGYVPQVKYMWLDHDTDVVSEAPPVLNQWYTVFDADDVRLIWCNILQNNGEAALKDLEIRWTIDGNVYFCTIHANANTDYYGLRTWLPSAGGTSGIEGNAVVLNAARYVDKRGQHFKVEVRIVTALGTNQTLRCWCVRETLEPT